jgi:hypothetical protein
MEGVMKKMLYAAIVAICAFENSEGMSLSAKEQIKDFFANKSEEITNTRAICQQRVEEILNNINESIQANYCTGIFQEKCQLAIEYFKKFQDRSDGELLNNLIEVTNNGFYDTSSFYISSLFSKNLENRNKAMILLDNVWSLLWQIREVLDVELAKINEQAIEDLLDSRIWMSPFLAEHFSGIDELCEKIEIE